MKEVRMNQGVIFQNHFFINFVTLYDGLLMDFILIAEQ
jgi:hypothetical protein